MVLTLPEDMLMDEVEAPAAKRYTRVESHPGQSQIAEFATMLKEARRPMVILGGTRWSEEAVAGIRDFAERFHLPVGAPSAVRCCLTTSHLLCRRCRHRHQPGTRKEIKDSDLIVLLGARMSEMPSSGYTLLDIPYPSQKIVHVFPDPEELGRIYRPDLAIAAAPRNSSQPFVTSKPRLAGLGGAHCRHA